MKSSSVAAAGLLLWSSGQNAAAAPTVAETTVLGPFAGIEAPLHPDNRAPHRIRFHGTDLGWTYVHNGKIHIIFGDTSATPEETIGERFDDAFGTIDLEKWPDPALITPDNIPLIRLGQVRGSPETAAIDPGHVMEGFKTPVGGFSNGSREFGLFYISKPDACAQDSDCSNGLTCDSGLGYYGPRPAVERGHTLACIDGNTGCNPDPMASPDGATIEGSGLCVNRTSSTSGASDLGRIRSVGLRHLIGIRSTEDPRRYTHIRTWLTTDFANPAVRTVESFVPGADRTKQDYRVAAGSGGNQRVFLWGRPGFVGVAATGRSLGLYFAYVDMPAGPDFSWDVHYYAGVDEDGIPRFSADEKDAAALDLDDTTPGVQDREVHDVVNQMSVAWIEGLKKWVMFYGGGMTVRPSERLPRCGVLEVFAGPECEEVVIGNGAIRMRTADHPWGPWSPPQDVLVGGDPDADPLEHQYAEGGVLYHPRCEAKTCAPRSTGTEGDEGEYGFLYAANIIARWTKPAGDGVDVIWNASTWNPYRVILLRTRINP